ncbi:MAG: hypothetical protein ACRDTC_06220 [Pseudonocardiaceae bacterium]
MNMAQFGTAAGSVVDPKLVELTRTAQVAATAALPAARLAEVTATMFNPQMVKIPHHTPLIVNFDLSARFRQLARTLIHLIGPVITIEILGIAWSVSAHRGPEAEQHFFALLAIIGIILGINPYIENFANKFDR